MIRFLQISDIHFKDKNGNDDEYRQMKCRFLEDIAKCQDTKGEINYILICGDIAFSGLDNEYKIAKSFIDTICDIWCLKRFGRNGTNAKRCARL